MLGDRGVGVAQPPVQWIPGVNWTGREAKTICQIHALKVQLYYLHFQIKFKLHNTNITLTFGPLFPSTLHLNRVVRNHILHLYSFATAFSRLLCMKKFPTVIHDIVISFTHYCSLETFSVMTFL
jgi:hypothetical protein